MESVSSEAAAMALAPHRHASRRRAMGDGASHADSTTASSQHNHTHHHHHYYNNDGSNSNTYDYERNGGVHKSSHTSHPIASAARDEEEAVNNGDGAASRVNGVPHSSAAAAAPPPPLPPNSHISSSHHRREHHEPRDERHEPEAEKPHLTHTNDNVVGAGVPSRASVGHSSRLPARTAHRTTHGAEAASSSWRSEALRAETMAEQEARRRDVLAAYLGITPLRESDVAALAPVPEFVDAAEEEEGTNKEEAAVVVVAKADMKKPASAHTEASGVHGQEEEEQKERRKERAAESAKAESSAVAEQQPPSQAPSASNNNAGASLQHQPPSLRPHRHRHHHHRPHNYTNNEQEVAATETATVTSHRSNKVSPIATATTTTVTAAEGDDAAQHMSVQDKQSTPNESQHSHSHHHHHHHPRYHAATSPPPTPHVADNVPAESTHAHAENEERSTKPAAAAAVNDAAEADEHASDVQLPAPSAAAAAAAAESVPSTHTRPDAAAKEDDHEAASSRSNNAVPASLVHADTHPSRSTASVHEVKAVAALSPNASLAPPSSHVQLSVHARSVRTTLAASRPASLAAAPQDTQSNVSVSSRGRPQRPQWVERLSVPASRATQSASVAPSAAAPSSSVHSAQHVVPAPASRPRSLAVRSATPQSALRGRSSRLASRSSSPGSAAAAASVIRRASSASCSARIAQLAQPRRRYDPVAEEKAVAEELALLQTEKVALTKSVTGAANTPRASVAGAAALVSPIASSSALRPSVVQRAAMNVRGRPIRVSAAATNASRASSVQPSVADKSTRMQKQPEQEQQEATEESNNNNNKRSEAAAEAEDALQNAKRDTEASNEANALIMRRPSSQAASSRSKASGALVVPAMSTGQATSARSAVTIPMDERVRLMQLPHAAYFPTTALRLDLSREEDMKELYRQQYLVDPQLHPRPARRQFRTTPQADLFGMYSRHPEWYNTEGKENEAAEMQSEEHTGRKQVPHRDGLQLLPSAAQKANDGMSILARFAEGGGGAENALNNNNNNNEEEGGKEEMSTRMTRDGTTVMVGTPTRRQSVQQDGLYASNVSHFNLFSWDSFDAAEAKEGRNGGSKAAVRGIAGRASVPAALAARDHLLNNMLPKENAVSDSTSSSSSAAAAAITRSARGNGLPGLYGGRALVRSRAAIQAQFAEQPENALPDRRPSARVTDAMQTLSAFGDHDIFGVEERNAQLAQRAAVAKQQQQQQQEEQKKLVGMNETTLTQDRSGSAVPYGGEDEEEGRPAEAPMFQPRAADGALMIH